MKVTQLVVYPVKSFRGIEVEELAIDSNGPVWDRKFMMVDAKGNFRSMRDTAEFALIHTKIKNGKLFVFSDDQPELEVEIPPQDSDRQISVNVFGEETPAYLCSETINHWVESVTGKKYRMVFLHPDEPRVRVKDFGSFKMSLADGYPLLLCTKESLAQLEKDAGQSFQMERFRPNIVVDGCKAFEEFDWQSVDIGELSFKHLKPCVRCKVTTIDPDTLKRTAEPLKTLASYSSLPGVVFGQNLVHESKGSISLGDLVLPKY